MELVVDTNIAIAALLREGATRSLIFRPDLLLLSPQRLPEEIEKHKIELLEKAGRNEEQYNIAVRLILSEIEIVLPAGYKHLMKDALRISPDPDDAIFLALALVRGCPLWSNDKLLKSQKEVVVYNTKELFERLPLGRM